MKNLITDTRDFVSAGIRVAYFVPLYRLVVQCERRDIHLPMKVIGSALKGRRRARGDWNDMKLHYFGFNY